MRPIPLALTLALLPAAGAFAGDGDADPTFSGDGQTTYIISAPADPLEQATMAIDLGDGSLLVGGTSRRAGGANGSDFAVVKYLPGGSPDLLFGSLGSTVVDFGDDARLGAILLRPDERILLVGSAVVDFDGTPIEVPALARLTTDGELDPTFGDAGRLLVDSLPWPGAQVYVERPVRITGAGSLLYLGLCTLCPSNAEERHFLLRLLPDGSPDPSFDDDGWAVYPEIPSGLGERTLALDGSDRILVATSIEDNLVSIWRVDPAGQIDPTFGGGDGRVDTTIESGAWLRLAVGPDTGRFVIGVVGGLWGLHPGGDVDLDYGDQGFLDTGLFGQASLLHEILLQSDGKLLAVGEIDPDGPDPADFILMRITPGGSFDTSFAGNGARPVEFDLIANGQDRALGIATSAGRLVAVGSAQSGLGGDRHWAILRTENALIFADGFERGSIAGWAGN
jgi:uncharacterized delta-60 repeat protein